MKRLDRILDWIVDGMPAGTIGDPRPRRDTPRPDPKRPIRMNSHEPDDERIRKDAAMLARLRRYGHIR